jgi:hypothetical protein
MSSSLSNLLLRLILLTPPTWGAVFEVDRFVERRAQEGKEQLERISNDPSARGCWASAVEALENGCRAMDDTQRSRRAVMVCAEPRNTHTLRDTQSGV